MAASKRSGETKLGLVDGGRHRAAPASLSDEQGNRPGAAMHPGASSITIPKGELRASTAHKDIGDVLPTPTTRLSAVDMGPSSPSISERVPVTLTSGNHETANPTTRTAPESTEAIDQGLLLQSDDQQTAHQVPDARDRTPEISVVDGDSTGEKKNERVGLAVLEEAVDDGTTVKTAGTLFFTALEAIDLPGSESHGGLLGYDRQNCYLSMSLEIDAGRSQEKVTTVQEGTNGAVQWGLETITMKYGNVVDTVVVEASPVWSENLGSDVIIGKATITSRHVRALALLQDHSALIHLPLSQQRNGSRAQTRGVFVARVRLVLDEDGPRRAAALGRGHSGIGRCRSGEKEPRKAKAGTTQADSATGFLVCSGLTAYDLPPTEGLKFGGCQDPYVKLALGPVAERTSSVAGGGELCDWTSQPLRFRVDSGQKTLKGWGHGLAVEVRNGNQPRRDALIGKGIIRPEKLMELQNRPEQGGLSCRVKLSRQGNGRKGTLSMVITFYPDPPGAALGSEERVPLREADTPRQSGQESNFILITNVKAKDLSDILAFGCGALDKPEPYVVARVGVTERTTPVAGVVSGKSTWADSCLALPVVDEALGDLSTLRLELWTSNAVQDDQVGYVEVDLASISYDRDSGSGAPSSIPSGVQVPLDLPLLCLTGTGGDGLGDITLPNVSCSVELQTKHDGGDRLKEALRKTQSKSPTGVVTLPTIGPDEGPGVLKVMVLGITLHEDAEAPEVRVTLLPGKRFASTRPLLEIGGDPSQQDEAKSSVTGAWNQELEIPCYATDFGALDTAVSLQADVVVAGVLAGQRVLGQGQAEVSGAIQARQEQEMSLDVVSFNRGAAPHTIGQLSLSVRFVGAWETPRHNSLPSPERPSAPQAKILHCPGILRMFVVDAKELSGLKRHQDPYVVVERIAADPTISCHVKPFSSAAAVVGKGRQARWLESCDLRVGQAEADFLRGQVGGGSITLTVSLTDKDIRGGDEPISSFEVVVTSESLAERESSVLWHRLFSQGRDRGFIRLGCCWIPADLEPVNVCGLRPEERVETGTLYLWLKEGRQLVNPNPAAQRVRGLPPTCEIELRPYAKVGRKKAREILGCARVPEMDNPDVDIGMFHKFLKMDFAQATPPADSDLADTSPSCVLTVYTKCGEKKVVSGRAEILLASLCGYKNLNGEAVLRSPRHRRGNPNTARGSAHLADFRQFGNERVLGFDEAELFSCPLAAVDKVIPLLEGDRSYSDGSNQGGGPLRNTGRGGELRLRALYVPDKVADALGVRAAIKALSRAAEKSMQLFTENPAAALSRAADDGGVVGDSEALDFSSTALPGALEVYLIRATELEWEMEENVDPVVQLRLLCSAGAELHTSAMGQWSGTSVEWNHQFSLLVDDANVEMLEVLVLDGKGPQGCHNPVACCKIPLRRYAQNYFSLQVLGIGQITPERFKLTDHRGRGFRGHAIISLNFLPEVVGQAHILREAFAPTNNLLPSLPANVAAPSHQPPTSVAAANPATTSAIHVLVISMDGGDVSREDRPRVRVSLAEDSDEWGASERRGGVTSAATSRVGVVDEEAAVCSWDGPGQAFRAIDGDERSNTVASGELLTLAWDPRLALSGWGRGRASVLKFEVSRGPGRPVEWTAFVPTAGLVHSPRCVFERAICLTGRLGSEPPTSARTVGSAGAPADRRTVSLEVAMMFQPAFLGGIRRGSRAAGVVSRGIIHQDDARPKSFDHPPFHPDLRRIACEGGELVVHCLRARNLRLPRQEQSVESRDAQPEIFLTVLPDGGEVETSTSCMGPGGRHPVWGQTRTLSIADAATARVVVRVRNVNQVLEDNVLGEVELSLAGLIAAEYGVAAAALPGFSSRLEHPPGGSSSRVSPDKDVASARQQLAGNSYGSDSEGHVDTEPFPGHKREPSGQNPICRHKIKPCGVEAWFPLFVSGRQGGSREREVAGEVRLCCRFLSTDFMMQREVTAGADEGDNGPVGALRYALERRPGRLFMTIRCCRALPKAMIGERAPLIEARLRHGGWQCSTRRQTGLNPVFNENMAVDVLWTPQDFNSPEVILEVKDKALGGGLLGESRL
ncbi:unnamed protein product, partial [Ectocarpus fasciculatus]